MTKLTTLLALLCAGVAFAAEPAQEKTPTQPSPASGGGEERAQSAKNPLPVARRPSAGDRLDLDTTIVTGNRELPKVLYIVPWKKADIGDLPAQPFNTLLDEALTPVDRDVFRREVTYYGAMSSGADSANPSSAAPAAGPEK